MAWIRKINGALRAHLEESFLAAEVRNGKFNTSVMHKDRVDGIITKNVSFGKIHHDIALYRT